MCCSGVECLVGWKRQVRFDFCLIQRQILFFVLCDHSIVFHLILFNLSDVGAI